VTEQLNTSIGHVRRCVDAARTTIVGLGVFAFLAGLPLLAATTDRRRPLNRQEMS
jgi:hypothetical protein